MMEHYEFRTVPGRLPGLFNSKDLEPFGGRGLGKLLLFAAYEACGADSLTVEERHLFLAALREQPHLATAHNLDIGRIRGPILGKKHVPGTKLSLSQASRKVLSSCDCSPRGIVDYLLDRPWIARRCDSTD